MARNKVKRGVAKPPAKSAVTPSGRRCRKGRLMAAPSKDVLGSAKSETDVTQTPADSKSSTTTESKNQVASSVDEEAHALDETTMKPSQELPERSSTPEQPQSSLKTPTRSMSPSPATDCREAVSNQSSQSSPQPKTTATMPSATELPTPEPSIHSRACTPEQQVTVVVDSSSELSSAPLSLGSTPEGLALRKERTIQQNHRDGSPVRRSARTRRRSTKAFEADSVQPLAKKRRLTDIAEVDVLPSVEESSDADTKAKELAVDDDQQAIVQDTSPVTNRKRKSVTFDVDESDFDDDDDDDVISINKRPRLDDSILAQSQGDKIVTRDKGHKKTSAPAKKKSKAELSHERAFYKELSKELAPAHPQDKKIWTKFNRSKPIMYGSDAQTQYTPAYAEPPRRGGRSNGRGAARGGRGGSGNGRGRGGKARGKGREDDSPEPPPVRKAQTQEDTLLIKHAKARQAELRRFFGIVGNHQAEILDAMAARDLNRLAKKSKAHKSVAEYEEILQELGEWQGSAMELAQKQYEIAVEAENQRFEAEKAAIEQRCRTKISDLQDEYKKGAQGDLIIFRRAMAAAHDETRTQDGSEADYFPQYHDFPEPDQNIRGYTSTRITDEKPFKHHLSTYDDQARREVIDDDVGPIVQAFARKNAERRAEEERKKTQTMEALAEEADKQLKEMRGYLIPRPMYREEDVNSFALSCLADVSEWMAQQYPNKQYIYMPLEDGDTFPKDALNYDRLPGRGVRVPPPPAPARSLPPIATPQQENVPPAQRNATGKLPPPAPSHGTRRSLRNLQPSGPLSQSQTQPTTPVSATPAPLTPVASSGSGPALAPAPPKLAPAPSISQTTQSQTRPSPIEQRPHIPTPPEHSPVQPPPSLTQPYSAQPPHTLPALQPRHMSQTSLPPPPPAYGYPQSYSPTHPPQPYPPPPPHHGMPSPYQPSQAPSSYHHPQHSLPPSPYMQPPSPYHHYGPPPYFQPPPPPPQQQYSFMPPQQGPAAPQSSSDTRPRSRSRNSASLPPSATQIPNPPPSQDPYLNGYHARHHGRTQAHTFQPPGNPSGPPPPSQSVPPPHHQHQHQYQHPPQPIPPPPHTTSHAKSRARAKAKQPVTFVNQTLATRKAAAEQLAKEEAAAAAEKKEKERDKSKSSSGSASGIGGGGVGNNSGDRRKLAPKP